MATLPSWITSIDPVAGVSRLLQGFGLGAQVGESQRRGEQADIELANRASQFQQNLAQSEAESLRKYELAQLVQKAKAETAARNLSGMYEYQQLISSGVPKEQALMQAAPNLFYNQPEKMTSALHELDTERRMQEAAQSAAENRIAMQGFRKREVGLKESQAKTPKVFHVGENLVRITPDGKQELLFQGSGLNPMERLKAAAAYKLLYSQNALDEDKEKALKDIQELEKKKKPDSTAPKGVKLRDKKTGALFMYSGNADEVPVDEFDVVE